MASPHRLQGTSASGWGAVGQPSESMTLVSVGVWDLPARGALAVNLSRFIKRKERGERTVNSQTDAGAREIGVDTENLYLEEVFTDLGAGTIRRLTPVKTDGSADVGRDILFMGQAQVMSAMGPLPLQFELAGPDLESAIASFPTAAEAAVKKMVEDRRAPTPAGFADRGAGGWWRRLAAQHERWRRYSTASPFRAAHLLAERCESLSGNEAFMFQPGVERPGGA